jgi:hypothetical protein
MSDVEENAQEIYRCSPRQARGMIIDCMTAGIVPFVQSSPGMGKSSIMRSIANQFGLELIDHRLSTSAPEDLSGLPEFYTDDAGQRRARFVPFDLFPVQKSHVPEGKDGWMLFLDEMNSGTKMVQAASYKLILDRAVGQFPLHERVVVTAAGNLSTDRAIVNALSTAMQSRVIHIEMQLNFRDWLEDVAIKENYDERVIAYLSYKPQNLMDFRPDHQEKTFCCPRTWEFMHRLINGKDIEDEKTPLYAGTLTSGVAVDFVQFSKVHKTIVKVDDVVKDPTGCPIPSDSPSKWMVITHLGGNITDKNLGALCIYANRMPIEFKVLFYRTMMVRHPELRHRPEFIKSMGDVQRHLKGDGTN